MEGSRITVKMISSILRVTSVVMHSLGHCWLPYTSNITVRSLTQGYTLSNPSQLRVSGTSQTHSLCGFTLVSFKVRVYWFVFRLVNPRVASVLVG